MPLKWSGSPWNRPAFTGNRAGMCSRVTFHCFWRTGLAPSPATGLSLLILYRMLGSAVCIRACVGWMRQHGVDGGVPRSSPDHLVARGGNGNLKSLFQKPQQRLPCGAEFEELAEHEQHPFLHTAVRILFQTVLALD